LGRAQAEHPGQEKEITRRRRGTQSGEETRKDGLRKYLYEKKDGIAYLSPSTAEVLNALNRKTVEELQHALLDARNDAAVRG